MHKNEITQMNADERDRVAATPEPPAPRGNPDTDHESVRKGKEQLEKVSGN
jgi:hypothetical protein